MSANLPEIPPPNEPESLEQTGLAESTVEQLILKILYFRGDLYGQELSTTIGLKFSVIQDIVETLKLQHLLQVKRSLGMGNVASVFALTETGRARTREHLESNQYNGPAPVPLSQYADVVRQQRPREGWLTKETLAKAFRGMVITERVLSQIGPAVAASTSMLVYGRPGDGKTFLIESLNNLDSAPIYLPYALECQGNIVQVYDPIYHQRIEEETSSAMVSMERNFDRRWIKCKRPFIVTGGELTMDMLDLRFNHTSKVYEAPFQVKANNGIYLIDDFGRQIATPAEVLNRWIVPMERRVDYLSFMTGGKMTTPFEAFMVFSTNLNPSDLGDEAFLRRIQYKMLLRGPAENEFIRIFESFCTTRKIPYTRELIVRFIEKHFKKTGKVFRRCHPRDVLTHALNLIHFEKLPVALTDEILDRAFESCFVQDQQDEAPIEAPILPVMRASCSDAWGDKVAKLTTAFGSLALTSSFRDRLTGRYHEPESAREYGEAETARVLQRLHTRAFAEWTALSRDQQKRDLGRYLAESDASPARLSLEIKELVNLMAPPTAKSEEADLFAHDLAMVLDFLCPKQAEAPVVPVVPAGPVAIPSAIEKIA